MIWIVDAHGYGQRFVVRADEVLTAFIELQRAIHEFAVSLMSQWLPLKCVADEHRSSDFALRILLAADQATPCVRIRRRLT